MNKTSAPASAKAAALHSASCRTYCKSHPPVRSAHDSGHNSDGLLLSQHDLKSNPLILLRVRLGLPHIDPFLTAGNHIDLKYIYQHGKNTSCRCWDIAMPEGEHISGQNAWQEAPHATATILGALSSLAYNAALILAMSFSVHACFLTRTLMKEAFDKVRGFDELGASHQRIQPDKRHCAPQ